MIQTEARNATLEDLSKILQAQQDAKLDFVAPAHSAFSFGGVLEIAGTGVIVDQRFRPTEIADADLADRLGIPVQYLRRLRAERPDLYDANVNGWCRGGFEPSNDIETPRTFAPDARPFLWRTFQAEAGSGEPGVLRAVRSDRFGIYDNLDVLTAGLQGAMSAVDADGNPAEVEIVSCDLSETRMRVRMICPAISVLAPRLLDHYRSPFEAGRLRAGEAESRLSRWLGRGPDRPVVFAGIDIKNSETGRSKFEIAPVIVVQVCENGLVISEDAFGKVHLGGKLSEGVVRFTEDTQRRALELVTAQARDAVATFLDRNYVEMVMDRIEERAGKVIDEPVETIEFIGKSLGFSAETTKGILDHFILGGQATAGGVLNAVTSFAQTVESPDLAAEIEASALDALALAAK